MTDTLTYNEWVQKVSNTPTPPGQRSGQHWFNQLDAVRPDLASRVTGVYGIDPFYNSECLHKFLIFIQEAWEG